MKLFPRVAARVVRGQERDSCRRRSATAMPRVFLRFLQTMVHNRRQMMIPEIAREYAQLLDEAEGRVHAEVTVARAVDDAQRIARSASSSVARAGQEGRRADDGGSVHHGRNDREGRRHGHGRLGASPARQAGVAHARGARCSHERKEGVSVRREAVGPRADMGAHAALRRQGAAHQGWTGTIRAISREEGRDDSSSQRRDDLPGGRLAPNR